jgi:hypothetical protein
MERLMALHVMKYRGEFPAEHFLHKLATFNFNSSRFWCSGVHHLTNTLEDCV